RSGDALEPVGDVRRARALAGVQEAPLLGSGGVAGQLVPRGHRPQARGDAPVLLAPAGRLVDPRVADTGGHQGDPRAVALTGRRLVHALEDPLEVDVLGLLGLADRLVVDGEVEDHVLTTGLGLAAAVHPGQTRLHDVR